ncbi:MAG: double-strand break repair helicase AddA [Parvularculaceae bacterium]
MSNTSRTDETNAAQRAAADPAFSVFVSANAGAGKTRVLTNRVARLLLNGVNPSTILCITFTKAASAEMAERLFTLLGKFTLAGDAELGAALNDLDGGNARTRSADELSRARRLFAQALETPGGLKIQTIHSFCESVLKRFPLEAGVPPGFTVIDEYETRRLAQEAVASVAAKSRGDAALQANFSHLLALQPGKDLREFLEKAVTGQRREFAHAEAIGWDGLLEDARACLGVDPTISTADIYAEIVAAIEALGVKALREALLAGSPTTKAAAPKVDDFVRATLPKDKFDAIAPVFLTAAMTPRASVLSKAVTSAEPQLAQAIENVQSDILHGLNRICAIAAYEDTRALYGVLREVFTAFEAAKSNRAGLDFDDLIRLTRRLLSGDGAADWALYKLDQGIAHILLDEAQDTGPEAWDVIEQPLAEFFAGHGARAPGRTGGRTFFAVGDKKQSIYSFQGADAQLFDEKEQDLGKKIAAAGAYANVQLKASFRTTAPVLRFVDTLFERAQVYGGVSDAAPEHHCTREGEAGLVELWPLTPRDARAADNPWDAPIDQATSSSPPRRLAEAVAGEIASWLANGAMLEAKGRGIAPGDIMILVQNRGALFHEMIRALGRAKVPVAGADRIALVEDQAVLDLISFARAVLYDGDDLSLAETLKGPFFNIDEDSLYDLAATRGGKTLWRALVERRGEQAPWMRAAAGIAAARTIALKDGAVAFFTHILETGAPSGWRRFAARLGAPAREPVEEFLRQALDFESANPRSLRLFLDAALRADAMANRESSEAGPSVRVMTAHKAKGLEADIVFLIDAHRPARFDHKERLHRLTADTGHAVPVYGIGEGRGAGPLADARRRKAGLAYEEYRRLLYVGATRARDRLYICGHEMGTGGDPARKADGEKTWHALAVDAFAALGEDARDAGERFGGRALRLSAPQTIAPKPGAAPSAITAREPLPAFFTTPAPAEKRAQRQSPSTLAPEPDDAAYRPGRGEGNFLRGRILHRLLEVLPEIAIADRERAGAKLVSRMAGALDEGTRAGMLAEALRVLNDDRFAPVFAPGSLAEAAIGGAPLGARAGLLLSGRIDRLAVRDGRILIVDYKTNRPPPKRIEDAPLGAVAQLAAYRALLQQIYPGVEIEAALLWTFDARLMPVPAEALDRAHSETLI